MISKSEKSPRDAAAVVLLRETAGATEICWARRNLQLNFLGGYHAFPGGKLEKEDGEIRVENCADAERASLIVCAAREAFEEIGVLLARGGEKLTKGQRAAIHDDLISGRFSFAEILEHWNLRVDALDFEFVGTWTTPPFSPARFKTRFFLAVCPSKQTPFAASGELETVEWIRAGNALQKWRNGEILCAPPILNTFRIFADAKIANRKSHIANLLSRAETEGGHPRKIELNPRFTVFPVRVETLPPATHTNCFVVGRREFIVIDAASPFVEEQNALNGFVGELIERGAVCRSIVVTHLHRDHTGGAESLQQFLREKFDVRVAIAAHALTAESVKADFSVDRFLRDGDFFDLADEAGEKFRLAVLHAPGHARGHLCFYDAEFGFLLSSDNIVGTGSVLIAPPEGSMLDYLASLERLKNLPNLRFLCGSHGAAVANAREKIESYIEHRLERERKILAAVKSGAKTPREIVETVYEDVKPEFWQLAEKSVAAHLEKLRDEGLIDS